MITVTAAPPFATIQDLGRTGFRDSGVPVSGIADRDSGIVLNSILGNDSGAAMIEWAIAGGTLRFDSACTIAIGGAEVECTVNRKAFAPLTALDVSSGSELSVGRFVRGRFLLVAVSGGIDVPLVMGSRSTLLSAAIGGLQGRRLRNGDVLQIGDSHASPECLLRSTNQEPIAGQVRVMRGPQAALFDDHAWTTFLSTDFAVSRASDRTGYRLEGPAIEHSGGASLPSEPACTGTIQIPNGSAPIVLMNDGPTIGGYPKIAVIRSSEFSRFAQLTPGDSVRFILDD
jgi:biotin-dependent carboxylase-like uncharacterized protein